MFNPNEHMMKLKGKDYLQVMWRLVWFREERPLWSIDTVLLEADADHAVFKAIISDENGVQKSVGHGSESKRDFGDFLEKAETKAVGRALAMLGYGTQFTALELDEGERIVDSPVERTPQPTRIVEVPAERAIQPAPELQQEPPEDAAFRALCLRKVRRDALDASCMRKWKTLFADTPVDLLRKELPEDGLNMMEDLA